MGSFLFRSKDLALALIGLALVFIWVSVPRPRPVEKPVIPGPVPSQMRVMSLNIHHGRDLERTSNLGRVQHLIEEMGVDLVGLQEVDVRLPRTGFEDQAAILAGRLGMHYAFIPSIGVEWAGYGNALLSRHPIESVRKLELPGTGEPRSALEARVILPGDRPVLVLVTHFSLNQAGRRSQAETLAARLKGEPLPHILLGDLNATPGSPELEPLIAIMSDAHAGSGQPTIGGRRIDYVLASGSLQVSAAWVPDGGGSDHLAAVAEISAQ